jgi:hypothetical protein
MGETILHTCRGANPSTLLTQREMKKVTPRLAPSVTIRGHMLKNYFAFAFALAFASAAFAAARASISF